MKFVISGKGMDITDGIRATIEKKLSRLEKQLPEDTTAKTVVSSRKNGQQIRVEVTIPLKNYLLRAEETGKDLDRAVDRVEEILTRQVRKYKTKFFTKRHETIRTIEVDIPVPEGAVEEEQEEEIRIVRGKTVELEPMTAEEACLQMDLLGHNFFMFLNADTDKVSVVYKRLDEAFGIIEPAN